MKTILAYGQVVYRRNRNQADSVDVFQSGVNAMRDGYNVKAFERITLPSGIVIIRKVKGAK